MRGKKELIGYVYKMHWMKSLANFYNKEIPFSCEKYYYNERITTVVNKRLQKYH